MSDKRSHAPSAGAPLMDPDPGSQPILLDSEGRRIPSPYGVLGLDPGTPASAAEVKAAFRARLSEFKVESDTERLIRVRAARDALLATRDGLEAKLHTLDLPNPVDYGLAPPPAPSTNVAKAPPITSRHRLTIGLALYALLEDELEREGPVSQQQSLSE